MIRNQRGAAIVGLLAILALVLFSGGVYYYIQNKSYAPSATDTAITKSSVPKEVAGDTDGAALESSMDGAGKTNLNDTQPTTDDLGL